MRAFALSLLAAISGAGCSKSAPPAGAPTPIAKVCDGVDGSRVRLTGTLRYRRGLLSFCSSYGGKKTCDLALHESAEAPPDFNVMRRATGPEPVLARLSVPVGSQPGEMDGLPKEFTDADVKLRLAGGTVATEGTHITVDGKLSVIPGDPKQPEGPRQCYVTVEWATP